MTSAIDTLQDDIACPQCEYNLRGLQGDVVNCPECGASCDRAELVTRRWTLPWHRAPGMTLLSLPVAWLYVGFIGMIMWRNSMGGVPQSQWLLAWCVLIVGWLLLMSRAWYVLEGGRSILLALLDHLVLAGYVAAFIILPILMLTAALFDPSRKPTYLGIMLPTGAWLAIFGGLVVTFFLLARWGEKFVASCCIRHYLRKKPKS